MPSRKKVKSLKNKYRSFFSYRRDIPKPESSIARIYPSLSELFEDSLEEKVPVQRNMDANTIQWMRDDRDRADQKSREMEGSLGVALQAIQRLEARGQVYKAVMKKEEPKKAPIILMEDNLTKAKRILMTPKKVCPTAVVEQCRTKPILENRT